MAAGNAAYGSRKKAEPNDGSPPTVIPAQLAFRFFYCHICAQRLPLSTLTNSAGIDAGSGHRCMSGNKGMAGRH